MIDKRKVRLVGGKSTELVPGVNVRSPVDVEVHVIVDGTKFEPSAVSSKNILPADNQLVNVSTPLKGWRVGYYEQGQWYDRLGNYLEGVNKWAPLPEDEDDQD